MNSDRSELLAFYTFMITIDSNDLLNDCRIKSISNILEEIKYNKESYNSRRSLRTVTIYNFFKIGLDKIPNKESLYDFYDIYFDYLADHIESKECLVKEIKSFILVNLPK